MLDSVFVLVGAAMETDKIDYLRRRIAAMKDEIKDFNGAPSQREAVIRSLHVEIAYFERRLQLKTAGDGSISDTD